MSIICYFNLSTYTKTGGIENFNKSFLEALSYAKKPTISVSIYDENHNKKLDYIDFENFHGSKVSASLYVLKNVYKFDVLVLAHVNLLPIALIAKLLNWNLKIYLSIYGYEVWKRLPVIYRKFLGSIRLLSISNYTTQQIIKHNGIDSSNIEMLPPSIDDKVGIFDSVLDSKRFNILSVTRLDSVDSYKGIDTVIESLPALIQTVPNLLYTIIGRGDDKPRLEKLASELGVGNYVQFEGFVEKIEPYFAECDVFIMPSKGEGFGIVYIEAMKFRKPCIACTVGGQTDVVLDGKTGYLVDYGDSNAITKLVRLMAEQPSISKQPWRKWL